jgi:hypothetical protein
VRGAFVAAADLDLRWRDAAPRRIKAEAHYSANAGANDLCGDRRADPPTYGAFADLAACLRAIAP